MIEKVVSGGQTGVDIAALDAAIEAGISHGGYCPKGRLCENGRIPDFYQLTETDSPDYDVRTVKNLTESDGTLIFSPVPVDKIQDGTRLTIEKLREHEKPHLVVCAQTEFNDIVDWINKNNISTLNVAGPRESTCPGVYKQVHAYLCELFKTFVAESKPASSKPPCG